MNIAMIGLGAMGSAIAACLLENGHRVTVWNRTREKAVPLVGQGASLAATVQDAVTASDLILVCIKSHRQTLELMMETNGLTGKTICDLSTGDTDDAEQLVAHLRDQGADYMLGMINAYPSGIGKPDTTLLAVCPEGTWAAHGAIIRTLGDRSAHVGTAPKALAALFAGLFTVRQGFMFGMIYGALACQKAGVPLQVFADQIPGGAMKLTEGYYALFKDTVPKGAYDDPEASLKVYALAQTDALKTFEAVDAPEDFIRLMHDRTHAAMADGLGDKQLTALVDYLSD